MKINHILLDMDGVVVHHFIDMGRAVGIEVSRESWPAGQSLIKEIAKTPVDVFNAAIIKGGAPLWANMAPFPWFQSFFAALNEIAPVFYLSAPEYGAGCVAGKVEWLEKMHGAGFDRYILTKHKEYLAQPGAVLVDDSPKNVEKFIAHGGDAILFRQPWNGHGADIAPDQICLEEIRALAAK